MTRQELILIVGMTAVTFGVRYPVLAITGRISLSRSMTDALKFIPPAVLTAIIVPAVLMPDGELDIGYTNAYLVAGLVAALVSWRRSNLLLTIAVGMGVFWAWRILAG
jgi:branched-subunit amino acid transport protein